MEGNPPNVCVIAPVEQPNGYQGTNPAIDHHYYYQHNSNLQLEKLNSSLNKMDKSSNPSHIKGLTTINKRQKHNFSWVQIEGKSIPAITHENEKYVAVKIIESAILSNFPNSFPEEIQNRPPIKSATLEHSHVELLNQLNDKHSLGYSEFSQNETIVLLKDFIDFYVIVKKHYPHCAEKIRNSGHQQNPSGWIQINNTVIPYIVYMHSEFLPVDVLIEAAQLSVPHELTTVLPETEVYLLNKMCSVLKKKVLFTKSMKFIPLHFAQDANLGKIKMTRYLPGNDPMKHAIRYADNIIPANKPKIDAAYNISNISCTRPGTKITSDSNKTVNNAIQESVSCVYKEGNVLKEGSVNCTNKERKLDNVNTDIYATNNPNTTFHRPAMINKTNNLNNKAEHTLAEKMYNDEPAVSIGSNKTHSSTIILNCDKNSPSANNSEKEKTVDSVVVAEEMYDKPSVVIDPDKPHSSGKVINQLKSTSNMDTNSPSVDKSEKEKTVDSVTTIKLPKSNANQEKLKACSIKFTAVSCHGKNILCLLRNSIKYVLLEAVLRVYFPNLPLDDFLNAVYVCARNIGECTEEEELAYQKMYGLESIPLKSKKLMDIKSLERILPELQNIYIPSRLWTSDLGPTENNCTLKRKRKRENSQEMTKKPAPDVICID